MDSFKNRLKAALTLRGMTATELSKRTGISHPRISNYLKGGYEAKQDGVFALAEALDVSEGWLMGFDVPLERRAPSDVVKVASGIAGSVPLFDLPVSAGTGEWLAEGHEYSLEPMANVPEGTSCILRVHGDSMEPLYPDGCFVCVRSNVFVEPGTVGVFYLNGEGFLKMLVGSSLVSLNPKYSPIKIGEFDSFFIFGKVIGIYERGEEK